MAIRGSIAKARKAPHPHKAPVGPIAEVEAVATLNSLDALVAEAGAAHQAIADAQTDRALQDESHEAATKLRQLLPLLEFIRRDAPSIQQVLTAFITVLGQAEHDLRGPAYHQLVQQAIADRESLQRFLDNLEIAEGYAAILEQGSLVGIRQEVFTVLRRPGGLTWGGIEPPSAALAKTLPRLVAALKAKAEREALGRPTKLGPEILRPCDARREPGDFVDSISRPSREPLGGKNPFADL